jgi:integrase
MSLQTNKQKGINLTRKIDAMTYLQKKGEIMSKHMILRGNVLYADCKFMGVHIRDSLKTNIPNLAEQELVSLKTLVKRGEYNSWKKTFEDLSDEWLVTRDMKKPHHISQEQRVRVHLKPYFGKLKVRDIIEEDEKTEKSMVNDFLAEIDHMPKESLKKIRYCLQSILKRGNQDYKLPQSEFSNQGFYQDRFLTQEELHEILDLLDAQYREVATFMAYTGLDISDVLKLEWSSVDMKAKMIRTERRKTMHNSETIKIKIPMVEMVETVLKSRSKVRSLQDRRIFQVEGGIHTNRVRNLQRHWRRACNKSSIDWHIRPKDLRHFFGSYLLNSGVDPLMIASFMGHASLDMLLKRYGHFTDQSRREAILKFDRGYTDGTQAKSAVC